MKEQFYIESLESIGTIELRENSRCKRLKLGINPQGLAYVVTPRIKNQKLRHKAVYDFVVANADWIEAQQKKMNSLQTVFTPETEFNTYYHKLRIEHLSHLSTAMVRALDGEILIQFPSSTNIEAEDNQEFIRDVIEHQMRAEAKTLLPTMLEEYASQFNLEFNKLTIKKAKSRWGSCSSKKNINLNLHLMRLPKRLIRYVVLHELAHTKELNHSPAFWSTLEQICPNARALDKELKNYNTEIY